MVRPGFTSRFIFQIDFCVLSVVTVEAVLPLPEVFPPEAVPLEALPTEVVVSSPEDVP